MTAVNFNETEHPRGDGGRFVSKPAAEPDLDLDLDDRDTEPGHYTGKPFEVTVQPQYWRGDYALDAGPAETFDLARQLHGMDADQREQVIADMEGSGADLDELYLRAAADGDVTDGFGPFYVTGDPQQLREWCADNPPWTPESGTPHPTGGYTEVRHDRDLTTYLADGELHREDGPALVRNDGAKSEWYSHGRLHREDGPAVINHDLGVQSWYVEGEHAATQVNTIEPGWDIVDGRPVRQGG